MAGEPIKRGLSVSTLFATLVVSSSMAQEPLTLDTSCTITVGNQTAVVRADGTFFVQNISVFLSAITRLAPQLYRARATCLRDGEMVTGQSDFFSLTPGETTFVADTFPTELDPIPIRLEASAPVQGLPLGESTQLTVTAVLPDGSTEDVTPRAAGTTYVSSNASLAAVDENGRVTGTNSTTTPRTVTIAILNEGNLASVDLTAVGPSNDFDNDGMPNDFEELFGLNPFFNDADGDLDSDGLTNLQEFEAGTLPNDPDTDLDGVPDGVDGDPLHPEESPPTIELIFPRADATLLEGETVTVEARARDDGLLTGVDVTVNGALVDQRDTSPARLVFTVPYAADLLQFSSMATDGVGNTTTVNESVPVSPDPLTTVQGAVFDASGNPVAGAEVTVELGGLAGEFFDFDTPLDALPDLTGRTADLSRPISALGFLNPEGLLSPDTFDTGLAPDFAGRFTGRLRIPEAGLYELVLAADDGARVLVDGVPVVEVEGAAGELAAASGLVELPPGSFPIEVDYFQAVGDSELQLAIRGPGEIEASVVLPSSLGQPGAPLSATTGADGTFSFSDVPSILGDLQADVIAELDGLNARGSSDPRSPVPGGLTDLGNIVVTPARFETDLGTPLFIFDDDSIDVNFGDGFTFPYFDLDWSEVSVNSNGNLTFAGFDILFDPSVPSEVIDGLPRISPLFTDLNPEAGGGVFVNQFPDRFVATWFELPQFNEGGSNTFQVILFSDGRIQFGYDGLTADGFGTGAGSDTLDIAVAVSRGGSLPPPLPFEPPTPLAVDYTADTPFVFSQDEAPFELFDTDGSFDLDGGFLLFLPTAEGGFEVQFVPPPASGAVALEGVRLDSAGRGSSFTGSSSSTATP